MNPVILVTTWWARLFWTWTAQNEGFSVKSPFLLPEKGTLKNDRAIWRGGWAWGFELTARLYFGPRKDGVKLKIHQFGQCQNWPLVGQGGTNRAMDIVMHGRASC